MVDQTLAGKVALVSGAAWGIGAAICRELGSKGALVICNYPWPSQAADAEGVIAKIRETGGESARESFAVEADLSTLEGPTELVKQTISRLNGRKIDILINNAGIAIMKPLTEVTLEQWDKQVNLNARGMLLLTQAVLPHLSQKSSRIVNTSSTGARQGMRGSTIYNGTKAMVEAFTRCWAVEFGRDYNCTVNSICPGPTNTHGFNHSGDKFRATLQPLLDATPAGARMAEPSEIANVVGFLCEEKAGWVTGVCLGVNGGFFMA